MKRQPEVGTLLAAVLPPPLGIFLARGLGSDFWIGTVLTILGWLPGVAFALFTILYPRRVDHA